MYKKSFQAQDFIQISEQCFISYYQLTRNYHWNNITLQYIPPCKKRKNILMSHFSLKTSGQFGCKAVQKYNRTSSTGHPLHDTHHRTPSKDIHHSQDTHRRKLITKNPSQDTHQNTSIRRHPSQEAHHRKPITGNP
jgi:hypothetical protein